MLEKKSTLYFPPSISQLSFFSSPAEAISKFQSFKQHTLDREHFILEICMHSSFLNNLDDVFIVHAVIDPHPLGRELGAGALWKKKAMAAVLTVILS